MKKFNRILLFASLILLFAVGCSKDKKDNKNQDSSKGPINNIQDLEESYEIEQVDKIKKEIDAMDIDEKLGQLLIVGFEGTSIEEHTRFLIEDLKVGGLIFFKRNIKDMEQVVSLTNGLKELNRKNKIPLFISIDEEGGQVSRLPKEYKRLPESKKLGDLNDENISFQYGELIGLRLKTLGFNLDYAPVMDINSNPNNPVIGNRAFGDNPDVVWKNGIEVEKGIKSQNIISAIKHFPGHGDTDMDSHIDLPIINKTLEDMRKFEFIPFTKSIENHVDMIMVAHILFPEIDNKYPSTMSEKIIKGILRDELEFNGVVISDDLTMGAIIENYTLEEATLKFFQSGGDIALICHGIDNPKKTLEYLKAAVEEGELSVETIDEKLYRILSLKDKYNLIDDNISIIDMDKVNVKTKEVLDKIK